MLFKKYINSYVNYYHIIHLEQISIHLVAFAIDSHPDIDSMRLSGNSCNTESF